jgi:hypothetical protein
MKGKFLTGILVILGFGLGMALLSGENAVSKLMESAGELISNSLGL